MYNDKIIITYNITSLTPIKTRDTMLKEVEDVECEINKQLDTAIKNGNVSYKNSCLPPLGSNPNFLSRIALFLFKKILDKRDPVSYNMNKSNRRKYV